MSEYLSLFKVPKLAPLLISLAFGRIGSSLASLTLVFFAIGYSHSPGIAGAVVFLSLAPALLITPVLGAILDRLGHTRLIQFDYFLSSLMYIALVYLHVSNHLSIPLLFLLVGIGSLTFPFTETGNRCLLPILLPKDLWDRGNALDGSLDNATSVLGPAMAGILIVTLGIDASLLAIAVFQILAALILFGVPSMPITSSTSWLGEQALDGLKYLWNNVSLRALCVIIPIAHIAEGIFLLSIPILALRLSSQGPQLAGALWALFALFALLGSLLVGHMGTATRERPILLIGLFMTGFGFAIVWLAPTIFFVFLGMIIAGIGGGPSHVAVYSLRQRLTHPSYFGRIVSLSMGLNTLGIPIGAVLAGAVILHSLSGTLLLGALIALLAAVLAIFSLPPSSLNTPTSA